MTALRDLADYVLEHTQMYRPGEVVTTDQRPGVTVTTVNTYPAPDQAPASLPPVDLLLTQVGLKPDTPPATREDLLLYLRAATAGTGLGEFVSIDAARFEQGPSYIELGAWLGSQDVALRLIGLGELVGLWTAMTAARLGIPREQAVEMAGAGFIMPAMDSGTVSTR